MKTQTLRHALVAGFCILHSAFCLSSFAQGTAFTYQGRLASGTNVANGSYDLAFSLWDAVSAGGQQADTLTNSPTAVSNGLFTVTLDFGPGVFPGAARWLEIAVRTNGGGAFTTLAPRQPLTPTPYAIFAGSASNLAGTVSSANLAGTYNSQVKLENPLNSVYGKFTGNGAGVTNVNAAALNGLTSDNFWQLGGNNVSAGQFLGSTNNQPVEIKANGQRALRLESNSGGAPNLIGGSVANAVGANTLGATIAGGDLNAIGTNGSYSTIGGGLGSVVQSNATGVTIGGGFNNTVRSNATTATISGGGVNTVQPYAFSSTIGGGSYNTVQSNSYYATIDGGENNLISANAHHSAIGGGQINTIQGFANSSVLGGGYSNTIWTAANSSVLGGGYNNAIRQDANLSVLGGGLGNVIGDGAYSSTLAGGFFNRIDNNATYSFIGGGQNNFVGESSTNSFIGGGIGNVIESNSRECVISGGKSNLIQAFGFSSVIAGGQYNSMPGGGLGGAWYSTIGGGQGNVINSVNDMIAGTIAGGQNNNLGHFAQFSTIGGGTGNSIGVSSYSSTIGGGQVNHIGTNSPATTIAGGVNNRIGDNCNSSTIVGGSSHRILDAAPYATILGGKLNVATNNATAAGNRASAIHYGSFVWADSFSTIDDGEVGFVSTAANQFSARATGGVRFVTAVDFQGTTLTGVSLAPYGTAWAVISDRNVKKDFAAVDAVSILEKLAAMPVTQWHYKWEEQNITPHIGPMAQDFKHAFYPGSDDKSITTLEADGVAFAAIQGLNEKVEDRSQKSEARSQKLETENAALKQQLTELQRTVAELKQLVSPAKP